MTLARLPAPQATYEDSKLSAHPKQATPGTIPAVRKHSQNIVEGFVDQVSDVSV